MNKSILIYGFTYSISLCFMAMFQRMAMKNKVKCVFSLSNRRKHTKGSVLLWMLLVISPVVVLATVRYRVGTDWITYLNIYQHFKSVKLSIINIGGGRIEPGYQLLMFVTSLFFKSDYSIFFSTSLLILSLVFLFCYKNSNSSAIVFTLFLFYVLYFNMFLNLMRQVIAAVILLLGFRYLEEKRYTKFVVIVILAMTFHESAIFALLFIVFRKMTKNRNLLNYALPIICLLSPIWVNLFLKIIKKIVANFLPKYALYLDWQGNSSHGYLLYILPVICLIYFWGYKEVVHNELHSMYLGLIWFQIPLQAIGAQISVVDRLTIYLGIIQLILIPDIVSKIPNKQKRLVAMLSFSIWFIFKWVYMEFYMPGDRTGTDNYQIIFNIL